jgi:hypothetical protein
MVSRFFLSFSTPALVKIEMLPITFGTFALFDSNDHPFAIDIGNFEAGRFRNARTRNIKREVRKSSGASSALNPRGGNGFCNSFPRPFLIAGPRRGANACSLAALGFKRTAIHFYLCRQVDRQEYSEFSKSA